MSFTEMVAEGMTLGEKNGIKRDWVVQFVKRMFPGFLAEGRWFNLKAVYVSPTGLLHMYWLHCPDQPPLGPMAWNGDLG